MILKDIQTYLAKYGKASLAELSICFKADANALRPMLKRLIRKGRIRQIEGKKCGGCHSCAPESIEFYEWVNNE
jgi:Mn-dependent DtxR family transcriptional regulator